MNPESQGFMGIVDPESQGLMGMLDPESPGFVRIAVAKS